MTRWLGAKDLLRREELWWLGAIVVGLGVLAFIAGIS